MYVTDSDGTRTSVIHSSESMIMTMYPIAVALHSSGDVQTFGVARRYKDVVITLQAQYHDSITDDATGHFLVMVGSSESKLEGKHDKDYLNVLT